eukprot:Gb_28551 [translate_table: standard]
MLKFYKLQKHCFMGDLSTKRAYDIVQCTQGNCLSKQMNTQTQIQQFCYRALQRIKTWSI